MSSRSLERARPAATGFDDLSPVPLYYRLASVLREKLVSGEYAVGGRLPTESEIATAYGVSRITVRQAIGSLAREGWLRRRRGQGTFVTEQLLAKESVRLTCVLDDLETAGVSTDIEMPEWRYLPAPANVATRLGLVPGTEVLCYGRRLLAAGAPFSFSRGYLPAEIGRRLSRDDLLRTPLLTLIERSTGLPVERGEQIIEATLADPPVSTLLDVHVGTPLLLLQRVISTADGRPVEFRVTYQRGDRARYVLQLRRTAAGLEPSAES